MNIIQKYKLYQCNIVDINLALKTSLVVANNEEHAKDICLSKEYSTGGFNIYIKEIDEIDGHKIMVK